MLHFGCRFNAAFSSFVNFNPNLCTSSWHGCLHNHTKGGLCSPVSECLVIASPTLPHLAHCCSFLGGLGVLVFDLFLALNMP